MTIYDITPCPKPRMTRSDKWKKRPCVLRYRAFCDEVRLARVHLPDHPHVIFSIPMPKSWSEEKKNAHMNKHHESKPDLDNLCKALLDALFIDDCHVWDIRLTKVWGWKGQIIVDEIEFQGYF